MAIGLDFPSDYIAREARAADLLVIGRDSEATTHFAHSIPAN